MIGHAPSYGVLVLGLVLLAPASGQADPVQGAVLGAGAGAAVGGGKGAAVGALLGGAGGGAALSKEQEEQARWKRYHQQQNGQTAPAAKALQHLETAAPIPTGTGLIKEIQRTLSALGYDPGPVDGLTDGPTTNAIRTYQEDHGLMTTGKASKDLLLHMRQQN
jgi:hypothetical protein